MNIYLLSILVYHDGMFRPRLPKVLNYVLQLSSIFQQNEFLLLTLSNQQLLRRWTYSICIDANP